MNTIKSINTFENIKNDVYRIPKIRSIDGIKISNNLITREVEEPACDYEIIHVKNIPSLKESFDRKPKNKNNMKPSRENDIKNDKSLSENSNRSESNNISCELPINSIILNKDENAIIASSKPIKDNLINQTEMNNEFNNDHFNHYKIIKNKANNSHEVKSRLFFPNKSEISINVKPNNGESFNKIIASERKKDRKSLQRTWPKCYNERLLPTDDTTLVRNNDGHKEENKVEEVCKSSSIQSDIHKLEILQPILIPKKRNLPRSLSMSMNNYKEKSENLNINKNSSLNESCLFDDEENHTMKNAEDYIETNHIQHNIINNNNKTHINHTAEKSFGKKNSLTTNNEQDSKITSSITNSPKSEKSPKIENKHEKCKEIEKDDKSCDEIEIDYETDEENESSREIHMKALSELQTSSALRARPDVVYGTMIPEPDYSDEEVECKTTNNTSSPNKMVARNNRTNTNGANNSPQKENKCSSNERFDDKGLILPKKLANPCVDSTDKKSLHRELLFNQKVGISVLNQKSELQKALEKHKGKQALKEQEKEKQTQLTPLQRAIDERAQRLEKTAKEENKEKDPKEETEPSSEFQKIHAKFRSKIEAK